jgi:hypothetical protein
MKTHFMHRGRGIGPDHKPSSQQVLFLEYATVSRVQQPSPAEPAGATFLHPLKPRAPLWATSRGAQAVVDRRRTAGRWIRVVASLGGGPAWWSPGLDLVPKDPPESLREDRAAMTKAVSTISEHELGVITPVLERGVKVVIGDRNVPEDDVDVPRA